MTELNITPEQKTDTQEHIDAMVAKAAAAQAPAQPQPAAQQEPQTAPEGDRPAWLPEKFKTAEDMARAYAELEKKQGNQQGQQVTQEDVHQAAQKAVTSAGLNMEELGAKIMKDGSLEQSDYDALATAGIPREMVDSYVAGQQALVQQMVGRMHSAVGGEENFNNILQWAGENLPKEDIAAFNDTVDKGSENAVKLALEGLASKYRAAGNNPPKLINGQKATETGDVFRSTAELTRAMNDPRYSKDPVYRAEVAAKLGRSSIF